MTTSVIKAAGAVLWRYRSGAEIALVHRPRYDDWSFPKGKLDPGEPMINAAVREVREETGLRCRVGAALGDVHYVVPDGPKVVRYWSAEALDGKFEANRETDELRWLTPAAAAEVLTYAHDRNVLSRFVDVGVPTATVVLVRHAKAGSRFQWESDDDLRPLSGSGREQVRRLAAVLPVFGPDRVLTAPPVRCRDTVAPLASALGLPVIDEPLLGEAGYWADPSAGLARMREIAATPGVSVLCSQGGVIPDVVAELAASSTRRLPLDPDNVPARKASTWVLTFAGGELRAADYRQYPDE